MLTAKNRKSPKMFQKQNNLLEDDVDSSRDERKPEGMPVTMEKIFERLGDLEVSQAEVTTTIAAHAKESEYRQAAVMATVAAHAKESESRHALILEHIGKIDHAINGNGKPGLFSRMETVERWQTRMEGMSAGIAATVGVIATLIAFSVGNVLSWVSSLFHSAPPAK